jgi:hypothetical protein
VIERHITVLGTFRKTRVVTELPASRFPMLMGSGGERAVL